MALRGRFTFNIWCAGGFNEVGQNVAVKISNSGYSLGRKVVF